MTNSLKKEEDRNGFFLLDDREDLSRHDDKIHNTMYVSRLAFDRHLKRSALLLLATHDHHHKKHISHHGERFLW